MNCLPFLSVQYSDPGLHNGVGSGQERLTTYQVYPGSIVSIKLLIVLHLLSR